MNSANIFQATALLILFPMVARADLPNGECTAPGFTCELDYVLGIVNNVASEEKCQQICQDNSTGCTIFSYYGQAGVPFQDTCLLFSDCAALDPCQDCYTEDVKCGLFCDAPLEGILGDNLIDFVLDVTEADCKAECDILPECNFYTYHNGNSSTYPDTCFFLTELREPIAHCEDQTCISGSPNCKKNLCGFLDDGKMLPNGIVVTESRDIDLVMIGSCGAPLAVAVGGGGTTQFDNGSGSGYVEYVILETNGSYMQFSAVVGAAQQPSQLTNKVDGGVLLIANAGGDGGAVKGADGYSGGGGDCSGSCPGGFGGSDGGDGGGSSGEGGKGSGLDISTIPMRNVVLSSGPGGITDNYYPDGDYTNGGGGGGGLLVNQDGPIGGVGPRGVGYGGGGGGHVCCVDESTLTGYQGVLILDFTL